MSVAAVHDHVIEQSFEKLCAQVTRDNAGRFITRGFSYMARMGRGGQMKLWKPPATTQQKAPQRLDWVLIKQIEMLQENGDQSLESLEMESGLWAIREAITMRATGVRLVIAVAGYADPPKDVNDQRKFDRMLDKRLRNLDRMVWFDELSAEATKQIERANFNLEERLPHVFSTLKAAKIYGRDQKMDCANIHGFFEQVADIPADNHLQHTVLFGLKSPRGDLFNRRQFNRLSDRMQTPFFSALRDTYAHFGLSVHHHMRGFGEHVSCSSFGKSAHAPQAMYG